MDVNAHKPRLEAAFSDALGMEVRIGIELLPLLSKKELRIVKIGMKRPRIPIRPGRIGLS